MRPARRWLAAGALLLLGLPGLPVQQAYVAQTAPGDGAYDIMVARLEGLKDLPAGSWIALDAVPPTGLVRVAASFARGHPFLVRSGANFIYSFGETSALLADRLDAFRALEARRLAAIQPGQRFEVRPGVVHSFAIASPPAGYAEGEGVLIGPAADASVINEAVPRPASGLMFVTPIADVSNYLAFIDTSIGHLAMPGAVQDVTLWGLERDPAGQQPGIMGVGRHLLFEVLNPVPESRLFVYLRSAGPHIDGGRVPPAEAFGTEATPLGFVGMGEGRMMSPVLEPRIIAGRHYVALDLGTDPERFPDPRSGLMSLHNADLGFDPRALSGFVAEISLLSPEQQAALAAPERFELPQTLADRGFLFSGLSPDGWVGEVARLRIDIGPGTRMLRLVGMIPGRASGPATTGITITIEGQDPVAFAASPGDVALNVPVAPMSGPRWIELRCDTTAALSPTDSRQACIRLLQLRPAEQAG